MTSDISSLRTAESESTRRESTWAMVASCCLVSVLQPASTAADSMATGTTLMSLTGGTTWLKETRSFGALKATVMPLTFLLCKSLVPLVLHHRRALGVYDRLGGIGNLYPEFRSVFVGSQPSRHPAPVIRCQRFGRGFLCERHTEPDWCAFHP